MRPSLRVGVGMLAGALLVTLPKLASHLRAALSGRSASLDAGERLHTERTFTFTANAPMDVVAPLFGAHKERLWAPEWNPDFVWPAPADDRQGMVFTVPHGHTTAVWLNTLFDPKYGNVQYAYVIPDTMAVTINLKLTPENQSTHVEVEYQRTALATHANPLVLQMANHDASSGPVWEKKVNAYLNSQPR